MNPIILQQPDEPAEGRQGAKTSSAGESRAWRYDGVVGPCMTCEVDRVRFSQLLDFNVGPSTSHTFVTHRESDEDLQTIRVLACDTCEQTVTLFETLRGPDEALVDQRVISPELPPRELDDSAPDNVRGAFREGGVCEASGALRAAAVMYRAAVEALATERGATGRNLYERITSLTDLGVDPAVVQDMHEARLLGNDSIHDLLEYTPEEVADVAELIEEAALVLYEQPAKRARLRDSRSARRNARG